MTSQFWESFLILSLAGAAVGLVIRFALPRILAWRGVWFCWHTRFGPALVFDSADADGTSVRLLNVNGTFQSVCYVDDELLWDPVCEYHRSWAHVVHRTWPLAKNSADGEAPLRRALVMGGGGFSFPKWLVAYRPDFACDAVEIDPKIVNIARERLFLGELERAFDTQTTGRLNVVVADAWSYVLDDTQGFDLIVNDAFGGNRPLGPMATDQGAQLVREHLRAGGVYIGNVRCALEGRSAGVLAQTRAAFEKVFDHVEVIPERPEDARKKGNNALVAWNERSEGEDKTWQT